MVVRVSFYMRTPIIISDPLHFDALLMAVHPEAKNIVEVNSKIRDGELGQLKLPLQRVCFDDDWIWAAGTIDLENARPFSGMYKKAKMGKDAYHLSKNIMTIGGIYKDNMVRVGGYSTSCASFLAATEDLPELRKMLSAITHLGKLRGFGYGQVRSISVDKVEQDWRDMLAKDGIAQRNLPASFCENETLSEIAALPPYWDTTMWEKGAAPGDRVILKKELALC